eukprot:CAMPEP_0174694680 /NCGR_PEP_ID=MMETSP1094-20130205/1223_1 /TAXON_ID=156173 /ORGANISM="Chrysochromulina brevifilum, Strain UTEX LB 985" /LENGTH=54 /DNA_ID=CAMNT_0015890989 /DNA_START=59 /DNA_END=223 /DNA_ORIENTATION=+
MVHAPQQSQIPVASRNFLLFQYKTSVSHAMCTPDLVYFDLTPRMASLRPAVMGW